MAIGSCDSFSFFVCFALNKTASQFCSKCGVEIQRPNGKGIIASVWKGRYPPCYPSASFTDDTRGGVPQFYGVEYRTLTISPQLVNSLLRMSQTRPDWSKTQFHLGLFIRLCMTALKSIGQGETETVIRRNPHVLSRKWRHAAVSRLRRHDDASSHGRRLRMLMLEWRQHSWSSADVRSSSCNLFKRRKCNVTREHALSKGKTRRTYTSQCDHSQET